MARKRNLTDPLNWILLLLAVAFVYYILAVPYFTSLYLKTPQEMTLQEYLESPAHPRPFMLHALSTPPSSIEIVITGLAVKHVDQDSILLEADLTPSSTAATADGEAAPADDAADAPAPAGAPAPQGRAAAQPILQFMDEAPVPGNEILIAGDNLDLLGVSVGQQVSLLAHGLHESPLGWVPQEPQIDRNQEEAFTKEELDDLEFMKLIVNGNPIPIAYVEVEEFRFAPGVHAAGEPMTLATLANDTTYIQSVNRLGGGTVDLYDVRLIERRLQDRAPYFVVEDAEGRRARVFFNLRLLSEWYWAVDRLGGQDIVVRGTLQTFPPGALRQLEADGNVQAVLDGYAILSRDGSVVINLENPLGGLGVPR